MIYHSARSQATASLNDTNSPTEALGPLFDDSRWENSLTDVSIFKSLTNDVYKVNNFRFVELFYKKYARFY